MNNQRKEISSGAFTLRFILAYILVAAISGGILDLILKQVLNISIFQNSINGTSIYIYSLIIAIFLIVNQWLIAFFTTKLSLLKSTVKKDDAYKAKRNMKIFLGIIIFLGVIFILGLLLIVLVPMLQRQINNPTNNIQDLLIPIGITTLGFIISLVVLAKVSRKTFDRIVFGDGTHKNVQTEANQNEQQVPVQNNIQEPSVTNSEQIQPQNTINQEVPQPTINQQVPVQNTTTSEPTQTNNNQ